MTRSIARLFLAGVFVAAPVFAQRAPIPQHLTSPPDHATGLADVGQAVAWTVSPGTAQSAAFVCHQVTAMTLTREWYDAGFEANPGIDNDRWQLKARQSGYITEWANPDSAFWNHPVQSPCARGSSSPDHVVLTVLSWRPACCTTAAEWEAVVSRAVANFKAKYADLKRIDLMTVIRGPGNGTCPLPPAANEYIAMPAELDAGLAAVAARFPDFVYVAPKFEASSCAAFVGGGPHLTPAGNAEVARTISTHFATLP